MEYFIAALVGYVCGSIPAAYILARLFKGVDIRTVGSGNVGSSNVWSQVGKLSYAATLGFDMLKGALPFLWLRGMGYDLSAQVVAGLAAIIGHNWPLWLRFVGGRGIATTGGVLFMLGATETILTGLIVGVGSALKLGPQTVLLAFLAWPLWAWGLSGAPTVVRVGSFCVWLLLLARRLQGSRALQATPTTEAVYWNRLWLDRDMRDKAEWMRRRGTTQSDV